MAYTKAYKIQLQGTGDVAKEMKFIVEVDPLDSSMSQSAYTALEKALVDSITDINAALTRGTEGWDDGAPQLTATEL